MQLTEEKTIQEQDLKQIGIQIINVKSITQMGYNVFEVGKNNTLTAIDGSMTCQIVQFNDATFTCVFHLLGQLKKIQFNYSDFRLI